jgi:hypothetical protein
MLATWFNNNNWEEDQNHQSTADFDDDDDGVKKILGNGDHSMTPISNSSTSAATEEPLSCIDKNQW